MQHPFFPPTSFQAHLNSPCLSLMVLVRILFPSSPRIPVFDMETLWMILECGTILIWKTHDVFLPKRNQMGGGHKETPGQEIVFCWVSHPHAASRIPAQPLLSKAQSPVWPKGREPARSRWDSSKIWSELRYGKCISILGIYPRIKSHVTKACLRVCVYSSMVHSS